MGKHFNEYLKNYEDKKRLKNKREAIILIIISLIFAVGIAMMLDIYEFRYPYNIISSIIGFILSMIILMFVIYKGLTNGQKDKSIKPQIIYK